MAVHMPPPKGFHPLVRRWFADHVGQPTAIQRQAWPLIAGGRHVLLMAPTGSGKTLAAFLWSLNQLICARWAAGAVRVLYVSPLKALNNDVRRNLIVPLMQIRERFVKQGETFPDIGVATRSGDTPQRDRRRMMRRPPGILITTPESLHLMLSSAGGRRILGGVRTVILDEIHAVVANQARHPAHGRRGPPGAPVRGIPAHRSLGHYRARDGGGRFRGWFQDRRRPEGPGIHSPFGRALPHRHHVVVERIAGTQFASTAGQVIVHTFWGGRVNRPFALAMEAAWKNRFGHAPTIFPTNEAVTILSLQTIESDDIMSLVVARDVDVLIRERLETTGLFGARFRECAGRALLLPRERFSQCMPLWLVRQQSQRLLDALGRFDDFPILLETWRTGLQDDFDLAAFASCSTGRRRSSGGRPFFGRCGAWNSPGRLSPDCSLKISKDCSSFPNPCWTGSSALYRRMWFSGCLPWIRSHHAGWGSMR